MRERVFYILRNLIEDRLERRSWRCRPLELLVRPRLLALVAVQQLDHLLADPVQVGAQLDKHLGSDALALADEAKQDVLGADVVVAELQRLSQRKLKHLLGTRGEGDVPGRRLLPLADDLLYLLPHSLQADPQ